MMMNVRESFDITDTVHHIWNGLWFFNTSHGVIIGMGRRDNIVFIALFAQVVIGACCAFISGAFEVLLVTSITSNVNVSNGGRIMPGSFFLNNGIRHICGGMLVSFLVLSLGAVDLWGWRLPIVGRGIRHFTRFSSRVGFLAFGGVSFIQ